ncbi:MAG: hypothetical protein NW224_07570 [Leptolyngbyaceae cyanobacterium bins.302]|nr:hypothetical protein [Leptolyngbyaceae cyanobacterium bins.302]
MLHRYSTEDLIRILAEERRACINGQRLNLAVSPSGSPFLDKFLRSEGLQKFSAYNDFRASVHSYQREHGVSGIIWQTQTIRNRQFRFPKIDDQLIALPEDLELLKTAKESLFDFWRDVSEGMNLYLSLNAGKAHQQIAPIYVDRILQRSEWASLSHQGTGNSLEIILQLGWGKPEAATYRRGFPESGSEYVHAVYPGNHPIV